MNPRLSGSRLDALYEADGFGGETTMRAKVIRELIDEIRELRRRVDGAPAQPPRRGSGEPEPDGASRIEQR